MATIIARETLEGIFQRPFAERTADHHEYLYRKVLVLEGHAGQSAEMVRLLLLKARVIADMEPDVFTALTVGPQGEPRSVHDVQKAAFEVTDQALTLAGALQDKGSQGRAHMLRGQLFRRLDDFRPAAAAYRTSVALLEQALRPLGADGPADPAIARDLLEATVKLASIELLLGRFDTAQQLLEKQVRIVQRMIVEGIAVPVDVETIQWLQALIARANGDLVTALSNATQAVGAYLLKEPSISLVRVLWVATEVALDLAEDAANEGESIRTPYVDAVQRYLRLTKEYAVNVKDPAGLEMAALSEARAMQLDHPSSKVPANRVRAVLDRNKKNRDWDWALEVDAYTTLGRLLTIRELTAEAREAFEEAVRIADQHHSPGMAWFARDALGGSRRP